MNNRKGFTLMEMLIVVALIAVLVVIGITVFTNQLEKAREATDLATIRQVCSELKTIVYLDDKIPSYFFKDSTRIRACIKCKGTKTGWQTKGMQMQGSGVIICDAVCYAADTEKPYLCINIDRSSGEISFNREAGVKNPLYN